MATHLANDLCCTVKVLMNKTAQYANDWTAKRVIMLVMSRLFNFYSEGCRKVMFPGVCLSTGWEPFP